MHLFIHLRFRVSSSHADRVEEKEFGGEGGAYLVEHFVVRSPAHFAGASD